MTAKKAFGIVLIFYCIAVAVGGYFYITGVSQFHETVATVFYVIGSIAVVGGFAFIIYIGIFVKRSTDDVEEEPVGDYPHVPTIGEIESRNGPLDRGATGKPITTRGRHW